MSYKSMLDLTVLLQKREEEFYFGKMKMILSHPNFDKRL